jgi:hypothetical protein
VTAQGLHEADPLHVDGAEVGVGVGGHQHADVDEPTQRVDGLVGADGELVEGHRRAP